MGTILGRGILGVALESVMTSEFAQPVGAVSSVLLVRVWRGDSGARSVGVEVIPGRRVLSGKCAEDLGR